MADSTPSQNRSLLLEQVLAFVDEAAGLSSAMNGDGSVRVSQSLDGRVFRFVEQDLTDVLQRADADGKKFIQINFASGHKVLFTETLVGFKPGEVRGLDMAKIPKVVTTPDLVSVFEAIEEALSSEAPGADGEIETLKKVFQSILSGGESAGFDLAFERKWLGRLMTLKFKASA